MRVSTAVERFISFKQAQGLQYTSNAVFLRSFACAVGNCYVNELTASRISALLNSRKTLPHTRYCRHNMLCVFFRFLKQIGKLKGWPLPGRPPLPRKTYVPFIYSRAEIRGIITQDYLKCFSRPTLISPQTLRAVIVFLYGTGVSLSEALSLQWHRVDFNKRTIEVAIRVGGKPRTIPIGRDICRLLRQHLASSCKSQYENSYVFVTRAGAAINGWTLRKNFRSLCHAAGVTRSGEGHSEPRLHDLRYTFAVHRIASWYKARADTQRLIPALAIYMGRVGVWSTERLMSLTPEHFLSRKRLP